MVFDAGVGEEDEGEGVEFAVSNSAFGFTFWM